MSVQVGIDQMPFAVVRIAKILFKQTQFQIEIYFIGNSLNFKKLLCTIYLSHFGLKPTIQLNIKYTILYIKYTIQLKLSKYILVILLLLEW